MKTISENRCFDGIQGVYSHASAATGTEMTFGLFRPANPRAPVLWFLSGLTCTHENAMTKAGLQAHAARAGIAVAFPDTSPRGEGVPDDDAYDMGQGAGFYVDATQGEWPPASTWRATSCATCPTSCSTPSTSIPRARPSPGTRWAGTAP